MIYYKVLATKYGTIRSRGRLHTVRKGVTYPHLPQPLRKGPIPLTTSPLTPSLRATMASPVFTVGSEVLFAVSGSPHTVNVFRYGSGVDGKAPEILFTAQTVPTAQRLFDCGEKYEVRGDWNGVQITGTKRYTPSFAAPEPNAHEAFVNYLLEHNTPAVREAPRKILVVMVSDVVRAAMENRYLEGLSAPQRLYHGVRRLFGTGDLLLPGPFAAERFGVTREALDTAYSQRDTPLSERLYFDDVRVAVPGLVRGDPKAVVSWSEGAGKVMHAVGILHAVTDNW